MSTNAGKGLPDRLPAPPLFSFPASYKTSRFYCPLVTHDAQENTIAFGAVAAADLGRPIPVLAFLSDVPGRKWARSRYLNASQDIATAAVFVRIEFDELAQNVGGNVAPWPLLLAAGSIQTTPSNGAGGANLGQAIIGTTLTAQLPRVIGYPLEITPEDLGMEIAGPAAAPISSLRLFVEAQGPAIESRGNGELVEYDGTGTVNPATNAVYPSRSAVILEETAYTAAIRAANAAAGKGANQVILADGSIVDVLGLWQQNPAP